MYYQPSWQKHFLQAIVVAESRRTGGCSPAPYTSLNVGLHTDDTDDNIAENRRRLAVALGFPADAYAGGYQVHGADVMRVDTVGQSTGCDAFVTNKPGILLSVTVADCTPVLLYDPVQKAIGAAHAGWRGTVGTIAMSTLEVMEKEYGTKAMNCWAYVGTCIDEEDFEVDADVANHFAEAHRRWDTERTKFLVDLKKANADQLLRAGLSRERIEISPFSTIRNNEHYFSHRKEQGRTGRMLGLIGLKK